LNFAMGAPRLSVVAPCYNEEAGVGEFVKRMVAACEAVAPGEYEILLVNDGSRDATWPCIRALVATHGNIVGLNLARNHGHQLAVTAGMARARGARILIIDTDLQDPPELLGALMRRMDEGFDVVYGRRRSRSAENPLKLGTAWLYYRLLSGLAEVEIPRDTGDFRLISRRILDRLNAMPEQDRFLRGMVAWLGGAQSELLYDREPRFAGRTGYSLAACGLAVYVIVGFLTGRAAPGWTSLALIMIFFSTMQLACLGILGAYVGRIFQQVKGRPLYMVDEIVSSANIVDDAAAATDSRAAAVGR
jgi:glycosyltransferase involved in cell wall biosynthesis